MRWLPWSVLLVSLLAGFASTNAGCAHRTFRPGDLGEYTGKWPYCYSEGPVRERDRSIMKAFLERKEQERAQPGTLALPAVLYVDNEPATRAQVLAFLLEDGLFQLRNDEQIYYSAERPNLEPVELGRYRVVGFRRAASPDCDCEGGEECEGFETLLMTLDETDTIVELGVSAAG